MRFFVINCCVFLCISLCGRIHAQSVQSISQGVSLHLQGQFSMWNSNSNFLSDISDDDPVGLGFGVELRYGFTSMLSGYLGFGNVNYNSNNEWEDYKSTYYRLGGQYNFGGTTSKIRPYLYAGGVYQNFKLARIFINDMGTVLIENGSLVSKGVGVEIGVGLKYHLMPEWVLELSAGGQFGQFGSNFVNGRDFNFEETIDHQHLHLRIGAGYFFY